MPNALAAETSPYLLAHSDNPVDWLPWDTATLERARREDRPLLVSIGYSTCHWCHVMERESFEDDAIAELMNRHFVCVKVDREERPDIDALYMDAVQGMTGRGGWPLHVFLTPEQVPFYGGTYFPPEPRHGMPSWPAVLVAVAGAWDQRRDEIRAAGDEIRARLAAGAALQTSTQPVTHDVLDRAVDALRRSWDAERGGFGDAPKFPPSSTLIFLLDRAASPAAHAPVAREMALGTLRAMAAGGIYDQIGGGFARYSVDAHWTVPHFEKMLYDNALLARAYLHGWRLDGDALMLRTCRETLDWALREMRAPEGGFHAAIDADSEGVEGRFYVWTLAELRAALGADARDGIAYFGASAQGNFDGVNVLRADGPEPERRDEIRAALLAARAARTHPALDDKRITAWNALMIAALADAGGTLGEERYLTAARECADFLLSELFDAEGRLLRIYRCGQAKLRAVLEDHAFLLEALLTLYEDTFEERWFGAAREVADAILTHFADRENGGFYSTADDHERLLVRRKDLEDSPIPSGSSSAAFGLLRLAALTGEADYARHAEAALRRVQGLVARHPTAFGHSLQALDFHVGPVREVALVGEDLDPLLDVVRSRLRPRLVLAASRSSGEGAVPLLAGRTPLDGRAAAYVCERFTCERPVTETGELASLLDG